MIWATMAAALAYLAWQLGRAPTGDRASLGLALLVVGVLMAAALSNRVQRRIRAIAAYVICRFWFDRR